MLTDGPSHGAAASAIDEGSTSFQTNGRSAQKVGLGAGSKVLAILLNQTSTLSTGSCDSACLSPHTETALLPASQTAIFSLLRALQSSMRAQNCAFLWTTSLSTPDFTSFNRENITIPPPFTF